MKNEIIKIAKDLEQGTITTEQAQILLLGLFGVSGRFYTDEEIEQIEDTAFRQGILDCENGGG